VHVVADRKYPKPVLLTAEKVDVIGNCSHLDLVIWFLCCSFEEIC